MTQIEKFRTLPETQIGNPAVPYAEEIAAFEYTGTLEEYTTLGREEEKLLGGMLKTERGKIRSLDTKEAKELSDVLLDPKASPLIRTIIEKALVDIRSVDESITEKPIARQLVEAITYQKSNKRYVVPNRSFLNVLEYVVHERGDETDDEHGETETVIAYKNQYEDRLHSLVRKDILPADVLSKRLYLIYETPLTADPRKSDRIAGYHAPGKGAVIHQEQEGGPQEKHIVFHELTHALASGDMTEDGDAVSSRGFYEHGEVSRVFNEGMTEMITAALLSDEDEGYQDHQIYSQERNIITALCECSNGQITAKDFVDVYFSSRNSEKNAQWLLDKLKDVYSAKLINTIERSAYAGNKTTLADIATRIYTGWANEYARPEDAERIADRILDAQDGKLIAQNFLAQSSKASRSLAMAA